MSAGLNVKVMGSGWFRHNSFGSVTFIAVAPGWLVIYLHFEGLHAIPKAYMIVAAASILDFSACLDAASNTPSSTKYCCHSFIDMRGHVLGHCVCVCTCGMFSCKAKTCRASVTVWVSQSLFGSFSQFLHYLTRRHGPVIMYGSLLHIAFSFLSGVPQVSRVVLLLVVGGDNDNW